MKQSYYKIFIIIAVFLISYKPILSQETWVATSLVNAPSPRNGHTAVWTGSKMIIWGGYFQNTGGIFDPSTNSWTTTDTANAPSGRSWAVAVWTGSKMIIWGGQNSTGTRLNTGGLYNPITNSWTPTTTTNAPFQRCFTTAVWTGSCMIVWGGEQLNTGGIYNPVTNTWKTVSVLNAPQQRYNHVAVWTGSKLIVWGGQDFGSLVLNTGGIYDTLTDSWTTMDTTNAPSPRYLTTAIWTGSRMIVFGGSIYTGGYGTKTGGIFDPQTNTWAALDTNNAPSARFAHSAVWTGSRMIIWGGGDINPPYAFNSGRIYNPSTGSWSPTSVTNAPSARTYHSAIWTGNSMIIWGSGGSINTGGIYTNTSIGINNINGRIPVKFSLSQNYPNPFNPSTKIRFEIPLTKGGEGVVSLKVYDILGKEVATLVNEILNPGIYEVTFSVNNLLSGVYFYKLSVGNFTETKKLVFLK